MPSNSPGYYVLYIPSMAHRTLEFPPSSPSQNLKSCMKPCTHKHSSKPRPPRWRLWNCHIFKPSCPSLKSRFLLLPSPSLPFGQFSKWNPAHNVDLSTDYISTYASIILMFMVIMITILFCCHFCRCNNCYIYTLLGSQCPFMKFGIKDKYKYRYHLYAYLDGVSSDNLAYINQASFSATLTISKDSREEYTADVYVSKHNKRLILAFKKTSKAPSQNCTVEVAFNLKESYFNDLLNSVRNLNPGLISRIVLSSVSFRGLHDTACNMKNFVSYCSAEQLNALEIMASRPSSSPPILLHGSFGTGKSRLLALSVHYFQSCQTKQHPVRVLACTQQRISADKFLEYYDKVWVEPKKGKVYVIREYALDQVDHCYRHLYFTSRDFENGKLYNCDNLLLITTCLTAPHLSFLPQGYFSHIFIDEGSLMREPEAVAPLFLADAQTKIVIAGDSNQVLYALVLSHGEVHSILWNSQWVKFE